MQHDQDKLIQQLYDEVQQELQRQFIHYQEDIEDRLRLEVGVNDPDASKAFVQQRKELYKTQLSDEWGEPPVKPFTFEHFHTLVADQIATETYGQTLSHPTGRQEEVRHLAHRFLYAELMQYLNSLIYEPNYLPDWQEEKYRTTLRFSKDQQRAKEDAVTTLSLRQTIAFYEIAAQFGVFLTLGQGQTLSAIAMSMCLASGYSKESIEKEMSQVSAEDYRIAHEKFQEIAQRYAPPQD